MSLGSLLVPGIFLLGGCPFVLAGSAIFLKGLDHLRKFVNLKSVSVTQASAVDVGPTAVEGEASPDERRFEAPFSGKTCLAYEIHVEVAVPKSETSDTWGTVASEAETVPFHVRDATGEVGVDPESADLQLEETWDIEVTGGYDPPYPIPDFLDGRDDIAHYSDEDDQGNPFADSHRLIEKRLDTGDDVTVVGRLESDAEVAETTPSMTSRPSGFLDRVLGSSFVVVGGPAP